MSLPFGLMMRVLLVDGSRFMRSKIRERLTQSGVEPLTIAEARNGGDALQLVPELSPDWVLSSWSMPEMGGVELLRELRLRGSGAAFGFVLGSEASPQMREKAEEEGARFVLDRTPSRSQLKRLLTDDS